MTEIVLEAKKKFRVLVVDDSSFMRKFISDILSTNRRLEVIGTAINGVEAVKKTLELKPDVITMDIEMPEMDGLEALRLIMQKCPTPVVMLSNQTKVGAEATVKSLEYGAVDFVAKPSGNISLDLDKIQDELILKVKVAARAYGRVASYSIIPEIPPLRLDEQKTSIGFKPEMQKIVVIGTSTGGPRALQTLLSRISGKIPASIVIVQHMPKGFTNSLAQRLNDISPLRVKEAEDGEEIMAGTAYIAPGDRHLTLVNVNNNIIVRLSDTEPVSGHRPSVDIMMNSAVECGLPVIGVLLTGMGSDGVQGLTRIKAAKGVTIAEDQSTCVVWGMPRAAMENNVADRVVPLPEIAGEISNLLF